MEVTKTTVNAPVRNLNVTWDAHVDATSKVFSEVQESMKTVSAYVVTQALKRSFLQANGTRVEVYTKCWDEAMEWCQLNCKSHWEISRDAVLSSPAIMKRELKLSAGGLDNEAMEVLYVNALARQSNMDAAYEEGKPFALHYMWFEDVNEALLFKLTWGGQ